MDQILAKSRAAEPFKRAVRSYGSSGGGDHIRVDGFAPSIKVRRLLAHMLAAEPHLPIERISLRGRSGCSDFVGTVKVHTASETRVYEFVWDEYCDWYVEIAKVQIANGNEAEQRGTRRTLIRVLETTLRLAHPVIPFITEELWQKVAPLAGKRGESIMMAPFPKPEPGKIDEKAEAEVALWKEQVEATRNLRSSNNIAPAEKLVLYLQPKQVPAAWQHAPWAALCKLSEIRIGDVPRDTLAASTATSNGTLSLALPTVDQDAERARLGKEIAKLEPQIEVARARLGNSSFVDRAPAKVVEETRRQLAEQEAKLADMRSQLGKLG